MDVYAEFLVSSCRIGHLCDMEFKLVATGLIFLGFIFWILILLAIYRTRNNEKPPYFGYLIFGVFWRGVHSYFSRRSEFIRAREILGLMILFFVMVLCVWFAS
jgi:hypothetical protein